MSARRCRGCAQPIRKKHDAGCGEASKQAAKNFAQPVPQLQTPKVYALPAPSSRADIADQERTLLSFYRPAGGEA